MGNIGGGGGESGDGMNPAGMMTGMMMGGAMGNQMAGMMNQLGQNMNQQQNTPLHHLKFNIAFLLMVKLKAHLIGNNFSK